MALRLRRGTNAERQTITPLQGEIIYTTDTKKIYVGDGATQGGVLIGATVLDDTSPQLGGNLDLNGNNITGTGNINIDGTITATGNIGLGDAESDVISVGGLINSSLKPSLDDTHDLGSASRMWANIWATQVNVDTTLAVGSRIVKSTDGSEDSAGVLWDFETDTLNVRAVNAALVVGDLKGSVFADDSTPMVNSVNKEITTSILNAQIFNLNNVPLRTLGDAIYIGDATTDVEVIIEGDSTGTALKLRGATEAFGGNSLSFDMSVFRGTTSSPTIVQDGDSLGLVTFSGYNGSSYSPGAFISAIVDDGTFTSGNNFDATIRIGSFTGFGAGKFVSINSAGILAAPVVKPASYETGSIPLGADVGEGSIVFDSTTKEFKGWNGSSWVVLG